MRSTAIAIGFMVCLGAASAADAPKKSQPAKAAAKGVQAPPMEQLTCRTGPNDEQVRLVVVVVTLIWIVLVFFGQGLTWVETAQGFWDRLGNLFQPGSLGTLVTLPLFFLFNFLIFMGPMLLMQGALDDNVLPEVQEKFAKTYNAAGGDCDYRLFENSVHEWVAEPGPQTDKAVEVAKEFIARQLKA